MPDDEIAKGINSLNSKQRKIFSSVVHTWAKDSVKYDGNDFEPVHIFRSGSGGTGKSHLVKVMYSYTTQYQKHCFFIVRTLRNQEFFYLDLQEYQQ